MPLAFWLPGCFFDRLSLQIGGCTQDMRVAIGGLSRRGRYYESMSGQIRELRRRLTTVGGVIAAKKRSRQFFSLSTLTITIAFYTTKKNTRQTL